VFVPVGDGLLLLVPVMVAGGSGLGTMMMGAGVVDGLLPEIGENVPGCTTLGWGVVNVLQSGTRQH